MEYRLRRADGEYRSLFCTGLPRLEPSGDFSGYIGSCVDITDLKRTQEKSLVGKKLESMGLFASGIAHDFSNLMGGILASSELALIQHTDGTPHQEELLRIKAAATAGAEIVRELLTDQESPAPALEPVDCSLLLREMLQVLEVSIANHNTFKTELTENLSLLDGNGAQIAIGDQAGEIRVTTKMVRTPIAGAANLRDGAYLQLEVADTGRGISDEAKGRIFDPFFTTKSAGRGLGLTIVQRVVHSHRGIVSVNSTPGLGSTFRVLLPAVSSGNSDPVERVHSKELTKARTNSIRARVPQPGRPIPPRATKQDSRQSC
jgi:signal transduction histidine kinase